MFFRLLAPSQVKLLKYLDGAGAEILPEPQDRHKAVIPFTVPLLLLSPPTGDNI